MRAAIRAAVRQGSYLPSLRPAMPPGDRRTDRRPAATSTAPPPPRQRSYPEEPRVGVSVIILRQLSPKSDPETLLIRRAKEPARGLWCFCGGSLELGETLLQAAVREALEETGLLMRCDPNPQGAIFSDALAWPTPLAAADSIVHDAQGAIKFHYAIVNFAATPVDPHAEPVPADDADKAQWFPVSSLRGMPGLVERCAEIAEEAVRRFSITRAFTDSGREAELTD